MVKHKRPAGRLRVMLSGAVFLIFFACSLPLFAQTGVSLETEIQNMERTANTMPTASERHDALVRLARLRQLSGDIEGAARTWLEAAAALPGNVDDDSLLACAYCLAAMGEWDRARTALEPLLSKSARARFLYISIDSINTGNTFALEAIAEDAAYGELKSEIYFLLYRTSRGPSAERWRQRLIAEFPQSPEGIIAAGGGSSQIMIRPSPFWFFLGGLDSLLLMAGESVPQPASPVVTPTSAAQSAVLPVPAVQQLRLQTGLFSRQANAQAHMAALRQAGFSPSIEQRVVNNSEMWAVTVPAGTDANRALAELRDKGFDAFLLRE